VLPQTRKSSDAGRHKILSGHVKTGQRWSWQKRPTEMARN
jgi:hypothetical protein